MRDIRLVETDTLSEGDIWEDANTDVWRAGSLHGQPSFYPIYRYEDYYSHSVIPLIRVKGHLTLNQGFVDRAQHNRMHYYSGVDTIDRDITRIGGMVHSDHTVSDAHEYARRVAEAMKEDMLAIEAEYEGYHHAVLCGGKDSLNILLLPWKKKLTVLSAAPNFALVREFVARNGLPHTVVELEDRDRSTLQEEILYNACFNNLMHCRWTGELRAFADSHDGRLIFWKGQLADTFLTPYWRVYAHSSSRIEHFYRTRIERRLRVENLSYLENRYFHAVWHRGAMWQGAHMSLLRSVCGALFLSAYHGKAMRRLFSQVALTKAANQDLRPLVGAMLHGAEVIYTSANPGPPRSAMRIGLSDPGHFLTAFQALLGLPVRSA